ncbi:NADH-quinone oxidoreductase subunit J family protein [Fodinibius sediminis]|uniref:NADH-quinone oxidoreductase subunit J n=1 Tax=Fodinibius sediminis TaxID=1214077 RepID=A0A521B9R7_9BACT|nr:NADH-quinone oxidoreductase subunit J [Fodinibius sediminis]SMO43813.1 NADH dehydrogenase subunit J [Fodinibius sediminis]
MITFSFIFLAVLAVASALAMVINKNAVNSALFLVLNMIALSGVYLLLKAQFLAIIQVLVYAGAIMVLFLFVVMLLNLENEEQLFSKFRIKYFVAFLLGVGVFSQLIYSIGSLTDTLPVVAEQMTQAGTVEAIGDVLYTKYSLPFHIIAMLLTAAVNGALMVAQHKTKPVTDEND